MFDIGSSELLLLIVVAVVVIGPKDLPRALYKFGQIVGKGPCDGAPFPQWAGRHDARSGA